VKRPGRPPLDAAATSPSEGVYLKLSAKDYDRAEQLAKHCREKLQDTLRRGLKRLLDERGGSI
jgi:exonuclease VII small subunit